MNNKSSIIKHDKLELGCGQRPAPGYLHQDITRQPGVELDFNCQIWEIPLKENSLSEIIALALMEHLCFADFTKALKHIYKLLSPGGIFLFDIPDIKIWSEYLYYITHGMPEKSPFSKEHVYATIWGLAEVAGGRAQNAPGSKMICLNISRKSGSAKFLMKILKSFFSRWNF